MAAKKINLLPTGAGGNKVVAKNVRIARQISYVAIFLSIIIIVGLFGANYYFNTRLDAIQEDQTRLKNNISSLEETEERLILTKDRISKISQLLTSRVVNENYLTQRVITDNLPDNLILNQLEIDKDEAVLEVTATNSRDLVRFMASLVVLNDIETLEMESLSFGATRGYTVVLNIE